MLAFLLACWFHSVTQTHLGITLHFWGFGTLDTIYITPEDTLLLYHDLSVTLTASGSNAAQGCFKASLPNSLHFT